MADVKPCDIMENVMFKYKTDPKPTKLLTTTIERY